MIGNQDSDCNVTLVAGFISDIINVDALLTGIVSLKTM